MSNFVAASVQSAAYGAERTKQEAGAAHDTTNATTVAETHDDFQSKVDAAANQAHIKKEEAVAQGKVDVEQAKVATGSYLDQARGLMGTALDKAQSYVAAGQERLGATTTHSTAHVRTTGSEGPKSGGFTSALTGAAVSALETTKGVLATAQAQLAATSQGAQSAVKPHVDAGTAVAKQQAENSQATIQPHVDAVTATAKPHVEAAKQALPDSVVDTSTPSSTAATAGSNISAETASTTGQTASPATISYPVQPNTEVHHVTTEGGAAPPERVDDKAVDKLAEGLTSTKITDASPATQTH